LGKRLEALLASLPAATLEKSLLASLQLSLDRLEPQARQLVTRLGVFQGGAFENFLLEITGINANDWAMLRPALESTGLIQFEDLRHLGVAVPYLKFHPTLAPALCRELTPEQKQLLNASYRQRYYEVSRYLYFEDNKTPHAARAIAERELPNLLHALYAVLQMEEVFAVDFVVTVSRFLTMFGLTRDQAELLQAVQQIHNEVGSDNWYLAQFNKGEALSDAGEHTSAEQIFQTLRQQLGAIPSYQLCLTLGNLGKCLRERGKTVEAIDHYQQALGVAGQLEPSESVQRQTGDLHTDLANAFGDEGNFTQAKT
jgi:tetratricopeptide (TPR) repeat protein